MTLIDCPRDAMQGIHDFIETDKKVAYINSILKCGAFFPMCNHPKFS